METTKPLSVCRELEVRARGSRNPYSIDEILKDSNPSLAVLSRRRSKRESSDEEISIDDVINETNCAKSFKIIKNEDTEEDNTCSSN